MAYNFNQPLAQALAGLTKVADGPRAPMQEQKYYYVDPTTGKQYDLSSDSADIYGNGGTGHTYLNERGTYGTPAFQWDNTTGNFASQYTAENPNTGGGLWDTVGKNFVVPAVMMAAGAGAFGGAPGVPGVGDAGWGMDLGMGGLEGVGAGLTPAGAAAGGLDLGGGIYMGADGAITGATAGVGGLGGAGGGVGGAGTAAAGAKGLAGLAGGGGTYGTLLSAVASLLGGALQAGAAGDAAAAQRGAATDGIAEQRRQFDTVQQLLAPYMSAGSAGLSGYRALSGLDGAAPQQAQIDQLRGGAEFGSLTKQGEDAILQNAAATGGLRGGNTQDALAKQRTSLLSALIERQLGRYGGLTTIGQNSATGVGSAALTTGTGVSNLMQQGGAAQAGGIVAGTNAITNAVSGISGLLAGSGGVTPNMGRAF